MKEQTEAMLRYADIIGLPHHRPAGRKPMSSEARAAQFAPFAALSGYEDIIEETARMTDEEIFLAEESRNVLDRQLAKIDEELSHGNCPAVGLRIFTPDAKKGGGTYSIISGRVKKIDRIQETILLYGEDSGPEKRRKIEEIPLNSVMAILLPEERDSGS